MPEANTTPPPHSPQFGPVDFQTRLNVSRETLADVETYLQLLTQASQNFNLVGPSVLDNFWGRHAFDCAQLLLAKPDAKTWADIGTGAGLPGLILAILLKPQPDTHVHMVESNGKKVAFLRQVIQQLTLPATVHHGRAESITLPRVDQVTARACAPADRLFSYSYPHMKSGEALFLKGQNTPAELTEAANSWIFNHELIPSHSDPSGHLLRVWELRSK